MDWWENYFDKETIDLHKASLALGQTDTEARLLPNILEVESGDSILDLCCGYGRLAVPLAMAGYRVTGVDISSTALDQLKSAAEENSVRIRAVQADMRSLPFTDEFDAAILMNHSFGVFHNDLDNRTVINACARGMRSGAVLLIELHNPATMSEFLGGAKGTDVVRMGRWDVNLDWSYIDSESVFQMRFVWHRGQRRIEKWHRLKIYDVQELESMCQESGFSRVEFYADLTGDRSYFEHRESTPYLVVKALR